MDPLPLVGLLNANGGEFMVERAAHLMARKKKRKKKEPGS
jgi:hypothetical protein